MDLRARLAPRRAGRQTLRFTGTATREQFEAATGAVDWYHSFFFDNGYEVRGDYDIGLDIDRYGFPPDLTGLEVLDVGGASGWFSFYFEQLGANVTMLDVSSVDELDAFGRFGVPVPSETEEWMKGAEIMAKLLGSNLCRVRARVYDVSPELFAGREFDLVFMGAILLHLRDPIGALMAARSVCRHRLVATNWFVPAADDDAPAADLPALSEEGPGRFNWWRPNRRAYELWFRAAGFRTVDVSRTVTLTADQPEPEHHASTQTLLLAEAGV